jgi:hypothetical protein
MKKLAIIMFAATLFGCKKEGESLPYTEVYGIVVSTGSQQPVDSVRVSIWDGMPCPQLSVACKTSEGSA